MRSGKNGIWIAVFISLLMVNIAVIVTVTAKSSGQDETMPYDGRFMPATDEVQLDWWPEFSSPGSGIAFTQPSPVVKTGEPRERRLTSDDIAQMKDYAGLMAGYIIELRRYLILYFHITPHRLEADEE